MENAYEVLSEIMFSLIFVISVLTLRL